MASEIKELRSIQVLDSRDNQIVSVECFLLYTSYAADDMQSVDLGGPRIIKK